MSRALAITWLLASALWTAEARAVSTTVSTPAQLTAAVAAAGAGDVITLLDGTYTLAMPLVAQAAGTAATPIRVTSAHSAHGALIVASGGAEAAVRISGPFWIFDGVDLQGGSFGVHFVSGGSDGVVTHARVSGAVAAVRADCGGADAQPHCDRGAIVGCDLGGSVTTPGCTFAGVELVGAADWSVSASAVQSVTVDTLSCPQATTFGVVARGNSQRATVERMLIGNVAVGIAMGPASNPCEVRGAVNNGTSCTPPTSCAVQSSSVRNSVIFGTSDNGVLLQNACTVSVHGVTLWNDGSAFAGKRSIEVRTASTVDVSDTILNADLVVASGATQTGGGNLTLPTPAEPTWFIATTQLNFRLVAGSPALDRGIALADLPNDFDGVSRPQGVADDVGAYERPIGGYPDGGIPMPDGGTSDGGVGGGVTGGTGGGMTQPPKSGCQCQLGGVTDLGIVPLLLLLLVAVVLTARRV